VTFALLFDNVTLSAALDDRFFGVETAGSAACIVAPSLSRGSPEDDLFGVCRGGNVESSSTSLLRFGGALVGTRGSRFCARGVGMFDSYAVDTLRVATWARHAEVSP
jgi:hypothetical protein